MKAIVWTKFGSPNVLQLQEVVKPIPKDNQVLIRVYATTVTKAESMMRKGEPLWGRIIIGFRKPRKRFRIIGTELAGEIESVGKDVKRFKKGDSVFGFTGFGMGAYAEYACMPEKGSLALKPTNKSYQESAAAVDGTTTALFFLKDKAAIQRGDKVLINGSSGSIGTYAVQLAKYFGAEVTGVCSTRNVELVASLGADHVVDYTQEDFTQNKNTYDIIFDTVGKSSFAKCKGALKRNGRYLPTTGLQNNFLHIWTSIFGNKKVVSGRSIEKNDALVFLKELIEADKLQIVIDRCYPLDKIAEAHRYVEKGHKRGNVVINLMDYEEMSS
jgi:NADPH2:quinone reductase